MRIINPRLDYAGLQIQRDKRDKIKKPAQQGSIINEESILLRFPSQNRTFSEPKTYGFRTKTVRFWDGNRRRMPAKTEIQKKYSQIIYSIFNIRLYKRHKSLCVPVTPSHLSRWICNPA